MILVLLKNEYDNKKLDIFIFIKTIEEKLIVVLLHINFCFICLLRKI